MTVRASMLILAVLAALALGGCQSSSAAGDAVPDSGDAAAEADTGAPPTCGGLNRSEVCCCDFDLVTQPVCQDGAWHCGSNSQLYQGDTCHSLACGSPCTMSCVDLPNPDSTETGDPGADAALDPSADPTPDPAGDPGTPATCGGVTREGLCCCQTDLGAEPICTDSGWGCPGQYTLYSGSVCYAACGPCSMPCAPDPDAAETGPDAVDVADTVDAADPGPADVTCAPLLTCKMNCPHGLRRDANGCDECACRDCDVDADCASVITCLSPSCSAAGDCTCDCSQVEGVRDYTCPDGTTVPWCGCSILGVQCVDHPETACRSICRAGTSDTYACPDGTTVPWCDCTAPQSAVDCLGVGTGSEGWYDTGTNALVKAMACKGCQAACVNVGTGSEGWSESCGGTFLGWASCAPKRTCVAKPEAGCTSSKCAVTQTASWTCPDQRQVPFCTCDVPAAACPPWCQNAGTASEGWYDSCSGKLIQAEKCSGCQATCDKIGSRSEAWYSSCTTGRIGTWVNCGTGQWSCIQQPWAACTGADACVREGGGYTAPAGACCPGLTGIEYATWDGTSCGFVNCPCFVCTFCGDGLCRPPENECNCPNDCKGVKLPRAVGDNCGSDGECPRPGVDLCVRPGFDTASPVGVCTTNCNPGDADPCGSADLVCEAVPIHQPAGFCLKRCTTNAQCDPPSTCAVSNGPTDAGGCYPWGDCDPFGGWGCPPATQCRVEKGQPICDTPGALKRGDKCDAAADRCGPGLTCGSISQCWPVCRDDDYCRTQFQLDFCLKIPGAPYGHCMVLE